MTSGIVGLQRLAAERKYDKTSLLENNENQKGKKKRPWKVKERNQNHQSDAKTPHDPTNQSWLMKTPPLLPCVPYVPGNLGISRNPRIPIQSPPERAVGIS
jgi:hypothetical protein